MVYTTMATSVLTRKHDTHAGIRSTLQNVFSYYRMCSLYTKARHACRHPQHAVCGMLMSTGLFCHINRSLLTPTHTWNPSRPRRPWLLATVYRERERERERESLLKSQSPSPCCIVYTFSVKALYTYILHFLRTVTIYIHSQKSEAKSELLFTTAGVVYYCRCCLWW